MDEGCKARMHRAERAPDAEELASTRCFPFPCSLSGSSIGVSPAFPFLRDYRILIRAPDVGARVPGTLSNPKSSIPTNRYCCYEPIWLMLSDAIRIISSIVFTYEFRSIRFLLSSFYVLMLDSH